MPKENIKETIAKRIDEPDTAEEASDEMPSPAPRPKVALLSAYAFSSEGLPVEVKIFRKYDFVPRYEVTIPGIAEGTKLLLETKLKGELVEARHKRHPRPEEVRRGEGEVPGGR